MDQHADPGAAPDSRIEAAQPFGPRLNSSREDLNIFAKNEFWRRTPRGPVHPGTGAIQAAASTEPAPNTPRTLESPATGAAEAI